MTNKHLLKYYLNINNITVEDACKTIGISEPSFYRKINGISDFYRHEILLLSKMLNLDNNSIMEIFFKN